MWTMIEDQTHTDSPTRTRTRRAILQAAVSLLSQNAAASMGEVAEAAGVARSTLHRYFPERGDLLDAVTRFAADEVKAATRRARPEDGPATDAVIRLCHESFDHWDAIIWTYWESLKRDQAECDPEDDALEARWNALIERGQAEGTIDESLPATWIQQMMWAVLYSAWESVRQGTTRHEALTLCLATMRKVIAPRQG